MRNIFRRVSWMIAWWMVARDSVHGRGDRLCDEHSTRFSAVDSHWWSHWRGLVRLQRNVRRWWWRKTFLWQVGLFLWLVLITSWTPRLVHQESGRAMSIESTQKGLQFYTGTFLDQVKGRAGAVYNKYAGLCLETQNFTDSVNNQVNDTVMVNLFCSDSPLATIPKHDSASWRRVSRANHLLLSHRIKMCWWFFLSHWEISVCIDSVGNSPTKYSSLVARPDDGRRIRLSAHWQTKELISMFSRCKSSLNDSVAYIWDSQSRLPKRNVIRNAQSTEWLILLYVVNLSLIRIRRLRDVSWRIHLSKGPCSANKTWARKCIQSHHISLEMILFLHVVVENSVQRYPSVTQSN